MPRGNEYPSRDPVRASKAEHSHYELIDHLVNGACCYIDVENLQVPAESIIVLRPKVNRFQVADQEQIARAAREISKMARMATGRPVQVLIMDLGTESATKQDGKAIRKTRPAPPHGSVGKPKGGRCCE